MVCWGGRRILALLAEDVQKLVDEFYPPTERASSGDLIWTCTADEGRKAQPGKRVEEYKTVTVRLPLVTKEDLRQRTEKKVARSQQAANARKQEKRRLARLVMAAEEQGGLLTIAELAVILNRSYDLMTKYNREWQEETGEPLPLKGYRMDQGSRPTHKGKVIRLFEQGLEPPDIAHKTRHNLKNVERYLKDYERVRMLLKRRCKAEEISIAHPYIAGRMKSRYHETVAEKKSIPAAIKYFFTPDTSVEAAYTPSARPFFLIIVLVLAALYGNALYTMPDLRAPGSCCS